MPRYSWKVTMSGEVIEESDLAFLELQFRNFICQLGENGFDVGPFPVMVTKPIEEEES